VSFDVFLQRFVARKSAGVDRERVLEVLRTATYRGPDEFGFYVVAFPDSGNVEFSASGLESKEPFEGCAFHIGGFGEHLIKFMFDVARAGDMVLIPVMEGSPLVLVTEDQKAAVPSELSESLQPVLVCSPSELGVLLTDGFAAWSSYRERVLRQSSAHDEA